VSPAGYAKDVKDEELSKEQLEMFADFIGGLKENVDFEKVAKNVEEVVVMLSRSDQFIPFEETEKFFRDRLPFVRVRAFRDAGHFRKNDGYKEFPEILEEILAEVRPDLKPVPESDLPVILPDDVDFKPTGESPLNYSKSFNDGVKEKHGEEFTREPDTLDTFMCSSWYYFRYLDPHNDKHFASPEQIKKWMPVDFYLGGPEHVNGHLLYSRFFTKVLYDAGYIDFDEPFTVHRHQGLIHGEDGRKMSKRWGNVINPSDVVDEHGADTLRMYEMFMGPLSDDKPWSTKGVLGVKRFLGKVWGLREKIGEKSSDEKVAIEINKLIQKVDQDLEGLSFNTSIAKMMEFVNFTQNVEQIGENEWKKFLLILAPFAPFITEELWQELGNENSIHLEKWPEFDESMTQEENVKIAIQVNGKLRDEIEASAGANQKEVESLAKESEKIQNYLAEGELKRVIYVQDRLINFVVA
ncbi:class I tRNA ligase family protein, partial [Candidatus Dojkabacteria bacterium]|nr:class I tRNA ligase family protein [Candidatus Dojkabacteria bacterium]